jgi:GNAT superfamily N-acetyltransferase
MKIRPAVPADLPVIKEFNVRLALESENLRLDPATVLTGVAAVLNDRLKGVYFVAETPNGEVVGQLMITYEWSDWRNGNIWWIQSVYVRPDFRGRGIFKSLFQHIHKLARETPEVCTIRLYLEKHNESARQAYTKLGLTETAYAVMEIEISH